jgi:hypothetical protein
MPIRRYLVMTLVAIGTLLSSGPARAEQPCETVLVPCTFEALPFKFKVVDSATRRPLADVHALVEWQLRGTSSEPDGPLMVLDATSDADGNVNVPGWGPLEGPPEGLLYGHDPVVSLFKSGYVPLVIFNGGPLVPRARRKVREFSGTGQPYALEPFNGTPQQRLGQLYQVWLGRARPRDEEEYLLFRRPYLNRLRRIARERDTLSLDEQMRKDQIFGALDQEIRFLDAAGNQAGIAGRGWQAPSSSLPLEADQPCEGIPVPCTFEAPAFKFTVIDADTRQPVADVHALAEWQMIGRGGRADGPLVVLDTVSGPDGLISFPAWGPKEGLTSGLAIGRDPVITLFKTGYKAMVLNNGRLPGTRETGRVHRVLLDGRTFPLEPFRGTPEQWVEELRPIYLGLAFQRSDDQTLEFREPYLHRLRRVWAERERVPEKLRGERDFFWFVENNIRFLEEGHR